MFGFSKSTTPTLPTDSKKEFPEDDLEIQFHEDDLNDPELLAELASMTMEDQPKPKPTIGEKSGMVGEMIEKPVVEIEAILAQLPLEELDDAQVEFTEEDMNNPELLAELASVTGTSFSTHAYPDQNTSTAPKPKPTEQLPALIPESIIEPTSPPSKSTHDDASLAVKLTSTNIDMLQQQFQLERMQAVNKKRGGDKAGALEHIRASKLIQARMDELQNARAEPPKSPHTPIQPPSPQPVLQNEPHDTDLDALLLLYQERILEYKKVAIEYKRAGEMDKAREMLVISKSIGQEVRLREEGRTTVGYELPRKPVYSGEGVVGDDDRDDGAIDDAQKKSTPATSVLPPTPSTVQTNDPKSPSTDLIPHLIFQLESQIHTCTKLSAQYFTSDQKNLALDYHKKKKSLQEQVTMLKSTAMTTTTTNLGFRVGYEDVKYSIAQTYADVGLDEICIEIKSGKDLFVKDVDVLETMVVFDFGWPSNTTTTLPQGKGQTTVQKGTDPQYDFKTTIKIQRTKQFQRFLERKKASFEVYYITRSLFGMMEKRNRYGKMSMSLNELLTKREVYEMVSVVDGQNSRKLVGGSVEIRIRMRVPLLKPEIDTVSERWVYVEFGQEQIGRELKVPAVATDLLKPTSPTITSTDTKTIKPTTTTTTPPDSNTIKTNKPESTTTKNKKTATKVAQEEEEEEDEMD
jgi:hypothetical protein